MGKPYHQGVSEGRSVEAMIEHPAVRAITLTGSASQFLAPESVKTEAHKCFVAFRPLGRHSCHHALELPILAGVSLRRAKPDAASRPCQRPRAPRRQAQKCAGGCDFFAENVPQRSALGAG